MAEAAGLPRVYDMALELISHSDGRIDEESLNNFLKAYHTVISFQLGELWAIPIMLRFALIENLRRVATQVAIDRINRNLADYWSKQMVAVVENNPKNLIFIIAEMARSNPPSGTGFCCGVCKTVARQGAYAGATAQLD